MSPVQRTAGTKARERTGLVASRDSKAAGEFGAQRKGLGSAANEFSDTGGRQIMRDPCGPEHKGFVLYRVIEGLVEGGDTIWFVFLKYEPK